MVNQPISQSINQTNKQLLEGPQRE